MIEGATPKLTISARESNCLPNSEYDFNSLATMPSIKSKIPAIIISHTENPGLPRNAKKMAKHPHKRFSNVMALGRCFFMEKFFLQIYIYICRMFNQT